MAPDVTLARCVFAHLRTDRALGGCYLTIALDDDDPPDGEPALDPEPAHPIRTA
jgi:hypothetical protein